MEVLGFLGFSALVSWLLFAAIVAAWADRKGHNGAMAFLGSVVLSPLLMALVVTTLSDRPAQALAARRHAELVGAVGGDTRESRTCPYCAETVKRAAVLCRFCGQKLEALAPIPPPAPPPPQPVSRWRRMLSSAANWTFIAVGAVFIVGLGMWLTQAFQPTYNTTFTTVADEISGR